MKIAGYLLIGLVIVDFGLIFIDMDLYRNSFIYLPDFLYDWTTVVLLTIGFLLIYMEKHKGKVAEFEDSLDEGETLLKSGNVTFKESLFNKKQESGVLLLTDRRLFYHGTGKITAGKLRISSDVGSNDFELLLGDISSVEITKFKVFIIIKDKDNNEFKLMLGLTWKRTSEEWKNEILKAVSGTD